MMNKITPIIKLNTTCENMAVATFQVCMGNVSQ